MKALAIGLLLVAAQALHVAEVAQSPARPFPVPHDPYDVCFELLQKILEQTSKLIDHINNKEWQVVLPLLMAIGRDIADDIACWIKPGLPLPGSTPAECVREHWEAAHQNLVLAMAHLWQGEFRQVSADLALAVAHLRRLQECFQRQTKY